MMAMQKPFPVSRFDEIIKVTFFKKISTKTEANSTIKMSSFLVN